MPRESRRDRGGMAFGSGSGGSYVRFRIRRQMVVCFSAGEQQRLEEDDDIWRQR